jgi:hypothetical protein
MHSTYIAILENKDGELVREKYYLQLASNSLKHTKHTMSKDVDIVNPAASRTDFSVLNSLSLQTEQLVKKFPSYI